MLKSPKEQTKDKFLQRVQSHPIHAIISQTFENCCSRMVYIRSVLKAYMRFLRLCYPENVEEEVLSLVEVVTFQFWTMSKYKIFLFGWLLYGDKVRVTLGQV